MTSVQRKNLTRFSKFSSNSKFCYNSYTVTKTSKGFPFSPLLPVTISCLAGVGLCQFSAGMPGGAGVPGCPWERQNLSSFTRAPWSWLCRRSVLLAQMWTSLNITVNSSASSSGLSVSTLGMQFRWPWSGHHHLMYKSILIADPHR